MKRKMKRALSIVLMICLFATCSFYQFEIDVQAAETIGISAVWGDTNETTTTFNITEDNQLRYQKNILVTAVLPEDNFEAGSKSVKITLADGLSWIDNGSVSTISNYFTNVEKLDDVSTYPGTSESLDNGSYVYYVKDDVTSLTLNLVVKYDTKTHLTDLQNAVTASYSYVDDSNTLQTGNTTASAVISLEDPAAKQTGIEGPQKTTPGEIQMRVEDGDKFGVSSSYKMFWKEVSISVTVPSDIIYSGDAQEENDWEYTKTDNGDLSTYTFTTTNKIEYQLFIDPKFTVPDTYEHGDTFYVTYTNAKVKYYDDTEETLTNTIPYKYIIDNALGVKINGVSTNIVNGSDIATIVNTINWTRTDTFNGVSDIYKDAECVLGYYSLENTSANTITDKVLTINFDTENIKVNAVKLFGPNSGNPLDVTVSYKTSEDSVEHTEVVTIAASDFTKNDSSNDIGYYFLFTENAGFGSDAYLTKISYTIPSIPGNARFAKYYYYGSISNYDALAEKDAIATIQLTDNYNSAFKILAQSATELDTEAHNGILSYRHESNATKTYKAGDTLSTKIRIYANSYGHSFTPTPVFYIRDETGLGIKNIKMYTYTMLTTAKTVILLDTKNGINPYGITVTELEREADGARVYKIDTTNVATSSDPYAAAIGLFDSSYASTFRTAQMVLQYDVISTKAYFDNSTLHNMSQKFYISDPGNAFTGFTNFDSDAFTIADPFDVDKDGSTKDNNIIGAVDIGTTYCITNEYGIKVNTSISETANTPNYRNINAETDSVNISESGATIKTTVTNTSFCEVNKLCIYIPIPKQGENWGNYIPADDTLDVSANLVSAIENPDSNYFSITYGMISLPSNTSKITQTLDNYADWSNYNDANRCNYNCIRITNKDNTKIPCDTSNSDTKEQFVADNSYTFYANLEYTSQKTSGMNYSIVRPLNMNQYMGDTEMITIKYYDSFIGISSSAYGKLSGCVWNDVNENGIKDSDETTTQNLSDWTIKLYKADEYNQKGDNASVVKICTTDSNGCYEFTELEFPQTYAVVIINKNSEEYVFTQTSNPYTITQNGNKQISNSLSALSMDSEQHEGVVDFGIQIAPVPSAEPSEEVTPAPSESAEPVPSEEVTPIPSESAEPSPSSTTIETSSTPDPKDDPAVTTTEPAPSESATPVPSEEVTPAPSESAEPVPSEEVTPAPSESAEPVPSESATPVPSEEATPSPSTTDIETTSTPDPKDDPTTEPSSEPSPSPSGCNCGGNTGCNCHTHTCCCHTHTCCCHTHTCCCHTHTCCCHTHTCCSCQSSTSCNCQSSTSCNCQSSTSCNCQSSTSCSCQSSTSCNCNKSYTYDCNTQTGTSTITSQTLLPVTIEIPVQILVPVQTTTTETTETTTTETNITEVTTTETTVTETTETITTTDENGNTVTETKTSTTETTSEPETTSETTTTVTSSSTETPAVIESTETAETPTVSVYTVLTVIAVSSTSTQTTAQVVTVTPQLTNEQVLELLQSMLTTGATTTSTVTAV